MMADQSQTTRSSTHDTRVGGGQPVPGVLVAGRGGRLGWLDGGLAPGPLLLVCLLLVGACASVGQQSSRPVTLSGAGSEAAASQILVTLVQGTPPPQQSAGSTPRPYGSTSRYRATLRSRRTAARLARDYGLREVDAWPIKALGVHCVVFEVATGDSIEDLLLELSRDPRVETAQPMQLFEVLSEDSYNDPYLRLQHGVESMQIRQAHRWAMGQGVTVAVIDTGVDLAHPELVGRISAARDFVTNRRASLTADLHGTAVAGVIASAANNGIGIVGVAPGARIMALKACWEGEQRSDRASCTSFTLAKAIAFALERSPDVINLSLSGPPDPLLERLVRAALGRGIVVVAAQRENSGDQPLFPSSIDGVIAVCAADDEGRRPEEADSSCGELRLLAPGREILTTMPEGAYDFVSGSSFAAAHVSGIAALLREIDPKIGGQPLLRLLLGASTGEQPPVSGVVVNACTALAQLVPDADCPGTAAGT